MAAAAVYPLEYFRNPDVRQAKGYCFVLMPFAPEFQEVFEVVKEVITNPPWNFTCQRADDFFGGGHVFLDILRGIGKAEVIVADLTNPNPNVYYELGIAQTTKESRQIILLTQHVENLPFDLRPFRFIPYSNNMEGTRKLKRELAKALNAITEATDRIRLAPGQSHSPTAPISGVLNQLYDFTWHVQHLDAHAGVFGLEVRRYDASGAATILHSETCRLRPGASKRVAGIPWEFRLERVDPHGADFSFVRFSDLRERLPAKATPEERIHLLDTLVPGSGLDAIGVLDEILGQEFLMHPCENVRKTAADWLRSVAGNVRAQFADEFSRIGEVLWRMYTTDGSRMSQVAFATAYLEYFDGTVFGRLEDLLRFARRERLNLLAQSCVSRACDFTSPEADFRLLKMSCALDGDDQTFALEKLLDRAPAQFLAYRDSERQKLLAEIRAAIDNNRFAISNIDTVFDLVAILDPLTILKWSSDNSIAENVRKALAARVSAREGADA